MAGRGPGSDDKSHKTKQYFNRNDNRGGHDSRHKWSRYKIEDTFYVHSSNVGKIIGKGGSKIKELEKENGVKIQVRRNSEDDTFSDLYIEGTDLAKDKVLDHIKRRLRIDVFSALKDKKPWFEHTDEYKEKPKTESAVGVDSSEKGNVVEETKTDAENSKRFFYNGKEVNSWQDIEPEEIDFEALNKQLDLEEKQKWESLSPIIKNFYIESVEVAKRSPEEVKQIRRDYFNIKVKNIMENSEVKIPNPVTTFEHAFENYHFILEILMCVKKLASPTPIQCQAWPVILSGHDLIGIAQTGTGKTFAYLLPALVHIRGQIPTPGREGPNVVILAPTRELTMQIHEQALEFSSKGFVSVCLYGGGERYRQIEELKRAPNLVVATPGRILDLIDSGFMDPLSVTFVVIDEADKMLHLGFENQVSRILRQIRPDRQMVLTSATWPADVRKFAETLLKDPVLVVVGSLDITSTHTIDQYVKVIEENCKKDNLLMFLYNLHVDDKVIIFVGRKQSTEDLVEVLHSNNIYCCSIHGDKEQYEREIALHNFKTGKIKILIATDVASRGLDIADITHIINYDFPRNIEDYVHRVGRTGRAGKTGIAYSFFTNRDWSNAAALIEILEEANQVVPDELVSLAENYRYRKESYPSGSYSYKMGGKGKRGNKRE